MTPIVGHRAALDELARAAASDGLHHAWLFAGPEGVGKATLATIFARRLLAGRAVESTLDTDAGDAPTALFDKGNHPDFRVIARLPRDENKPEQGLARSIKVDQIRALGRFLTTKPSMSARRVLIVDAADDLEREGANALLKMLEEPPEGTIFLLVSHMPGRLLPTIRSRCRVLRFEALSDADVGRVVRARLPDADDGEVASLIRAGNGSPGRALRFAGLDLGAIERDLERVATEGDVTNAIRARLAKALSTKAAEARYDAVLERVPSFIAAAARTRSGAALAEAITAYGEARRIAGASAGLSLDAQTTVFQLVGQVARLAR